MRVTQGGVYVMVKKYGIDSAIFWFALTLRVILFVISLNQIVRNVNLNYCIYLHIGSLVVILCIAFLVFVYVLILNFVDLYRDYNKRRISSYIEFQPSQDIDCSICLDYENRVGIVLNQCNHKFHDKCIREWIKIKQECPVCRNTIMC
mgnify:CR=1 FL=1